MTAGAEEAGDEEGRALKKMANSTKELKEAEDRWLIGGVIFCTLCIHWIGEPESHSVINGILLVAAGAGVFGLYEAARVIGKWVRRRKV